MVIAWINQSKERLVSGHIIMCVIYLSHVPFFGYYYVLNTSLSYAIMCDIPLNCVPLCVIYLPIVWLMCVIRPILCIYVWYTFPLCVIMYDISYLPLRKYYILNTSLSYASIYSIPPYFMPSFEVVLHTIYIPIMC